MRSRLSRLLAIALVLVALLVLPRRAAADDIFWGIPSCADVEDNIAWLQGASFQIIGYAGELAAFGLPVYSFQIVYGNSYGYGYCY